MLGKKLVGKGQKYFRLFLAACSRREAVMYPPGLADRGEHFVEHPFFKALRAGQPTMNDQAVHITLRDEGHLSGHRLRWGWNVSFHPSAWSRTCLVGDCCTPGPLPHPNRKTDICRSARSLGCCQIRCYLKTAILFIHSGPPFRRPQFRAATSLGLVVSSL